jgi:hypothetical protein
MYAHRTTENKRIILHARKATALQPNKFVTEILPFLVASNGRSACPSANLFQGRLQTPLEYWSFRVDSRAI